MLTCLFKVKAQHIPGSRIDSLDHRPLLMINGKKVDPLSFFTLDRQQFKNFKVITPEQAMKRFGYDAGKFGAIEITLVKEAKLLNWTQLAKRFYFIADQLPVNGHFNWGYGGLDFNDPRLFAAAPSTITYFSIGRSHEAPYGQVVWIAQRGVLPPKKEIKPTPFDKEIGAFEQIFIIESNKRSAIENAKPLLQG
ncbi:MAG: hypothetical protein V4560_08610 [Bacteroidota bacterium]